MSRLAPPHAVVVAVVAVVAGLPIPSAGTWNTGEDQQMRAVNEAPGFEAVGCPGSWRRPTAG